MTFFFWCQRIIRSLAALPLVLGCVGLLGVAVAKPSEASPEQPTKSVVSRQENLPAMQDVRSSGMRPVACPAEETNRMLYVIGVILLMLALAETAYVLHLWDQRSRLQKRLAETTAQQSQVNMQMEFQAFYDPLTQLPNRRLFRERLLEAIKVASRHNHAFGVMMTDLDHFKEVNDTMGHDAGDLLLTEVANRFRRVIRETDTIARLGGDEFALICQGVSDMKTASLVCMRVIEVFREPIMVKGKACQVGISLGVALYPDHATDDEMLLRRADTALYRAKQKRNTFTLFDPNLDRPAKP